MPNTNIKTKRHVAHLEQVHRQERMIKIISSIIIVIVLGLVLYGFVIDPAIKPYRAVASVNGDTINVGKFQAEAKIQRMQLVRNYMQYVQYAQMFGIQDPTTDQNFGPAMQQIQAQLNDTAQLGQNVIDLVVDDQLIRQEAKRRNITVSAADVEKILQEGVGYFPDGSPTPTETSVVVVEPTLNATQLAIITITPTPGGETPAPTPTTDPAVTPTITPTPTTTPTTGPSVTPPPTLTPLPTSTPLTEAGYKDLIKKQLDDFSKESSISEADFRSYYESSLYRKRVRDAVLVDLKPIQEQVWARHILVGTEEEAKQVLARLQKGEDFGKIAIEKSIDTGSAPQGGDLGWFAKGGGATEFENSAFALKIGEISQPVQSPDGYHIIQVLGHADRELSTEAFEQYKEQTFTEFLTKLRTDSKVEIFDLWKEVVPTEPTLPTS